MLIRIAEQPVVMQPASGDTEGPRRVMTASNIAVSKWWDRPPANRWLGMLGLMLAIIAILIYLWFRFEWQFARRQDRQRA